jgi:hypothetical protein
MDAVLLPGLSLFGSLGRCIRGRIGGHRQRYDGQTQSNDHNRKSAQHGDSLLIK